MEAFASNLRLCTALHTLLKVLDLRSLTQKRFISKAAERCLRVLAQQVPADTSQQQEIASTLRKELAQDHGILMVAYDVPHKEWKCVLVNCGDIGVDTVRRMAARLVIPVPADLDSTSVCGLDDTRSVSSCGSRRPGLPTAAGSIPHATALPKTNLSDFLAANRIASLMMLSGSKLTPTAGKALCELPLHVEIFHEADLQWFALNHTLVPKYHIMTEEELSLKFPVIVDAATGKRRSDRYKQAEIRVDTDMTAKLLGIRVSDVVVYTRAFSGIPPHQKYRIGVSG